MQGMPAILQKKTLILRNFKLVKYISLTLIQMSLASCIIPYSDSISSTRSKFEAGINKAKEDPGSWILIGKYIEKGTYCSGFEEHVPPCIVQMTELKNLYPSQLKVIFLDGTNPDETPLSIQKTEQMLRSLTEVQAGLVIEQIANSERAKYLWAYFVHTDLPYATRLLLSIRNAKMGILPNNLPSKEVPYALVTLLDSLDVEAKARFLQELQKTDAHLVKLLAPSFK